jgi:CBS domain-containing membrane protein
MLKIKSLAKSISFYLGSDQPLTGWTERIRSSFGALLGLMLVLFIAKLLGELSGSQKWLMASLGASALLVFALPQSPLAQPWAVIVGNVSSALVGITCFNWISEPLLAMPIAAASSIMSMFFMRCLHPPSAALAMIPILGHIGGYRYAFFPVMIDSVLLVLTGAVYSNLTGKPYPNRPTR